MENNQPAPEGEKEWNSDEILVGELTCEQTARMLAAFVSALRLFNGAKKAQGDKGIVMAAYKILAHQLTMLNEPIEDDKAKKLVETSISLAVIAIGQAMVCASSGTTDPRAIVSITENALAAVNEMVKREGPESLNDKHIMFNVKKTGEDEFLIGTFLKSSNDIKQEVDKLSSATKAKGEIIKIGGLKKKYL